MWYDKPASSWMREALPVGNGYMGVMFFGGVEKEQIQFTEGSLWTGGPASGQEYNYGNRDSAFVYLPQVRALLDEDKFDEAAVVMQEHLTGELHLTDSTRGTNDFGEQQTMGDLFISVLTPLDSVTGYRRSLNLSTGRGNVEFLTGKIKHERTYFGDYPDKIMVYSYKTDSPLSYGISLTTPHITDSVAFVDETLIYKGHLLDNNMRFETQVRFVTDGVLVFKNDTVFIDNATVFYLCHTAATSYKNEYPLYEGNNCEQICNDIQNESAQKTYREIEKTQAADYSELFNRVELELGDGTDNLPIDVRLKNYSEGAEDLGIEEIYFQYGRYLMISASRKGALPMNLQGKWNNSTRPPWTCDYHLNINLEMLYWPAEIANLPECHEPLMDYVASLVEPGRVTAHEFYDTRGWVANTVNNPFGYTAPGCSTEWGCFPAGAAWISRHLWDHYRYNNDTVFLRQKALPVMKEAAMFWVDYLIPDDSGYLVSCPSFSPEHGGISKGASMDHQIAMDIVTNCIDAYNVLGIKDAFLDTLLYLKNHICPPEIGRWGQLKEWREDVDDPIDKHRHVSHLYALYPACQITLEGTPELAEAAKVSLNARGDEGTGWSLAWKVNFWARLQNGDRAYSLLRKVLTRVDDEGYNMMNGGGSYENLLCAHPPFQLDGNMGAVAGIAEMLLDPITGKPLPALPSAWKNGYVKGLKTQKGETVDIEWREGKVVKLVVGD